MSEAFYGQIMPWPIGYAPMNWAFCDGRLLQIAQYDALFALIGNTFGGDGITTFALPDLRSRIPVGTGTGPGRSSYIRGQAGGYEQVNLFANNLPAHTHPTPASTTEANKGAPGASLAPATEPNGSVYKLYASPVNTNLAPTGDNTAGNQAVENRQPWLALNYIICYNGVWPQRP